MLPTMTVSPPPSTQSLAQAQGSGPRLLGEGAQSDERLTVTVQQRAYLDGLKAAGIRPSTDLLALSIGSYICQARAAKQSDQALRDYVRPMVRSDLRNIQMNTDAPPAEVDGVTADYIRIATERLC